MKSLFLILFISLPVLAKTQATHTIGWHWAIDGDGLETFGDAVVGNDGYTYLVGGMNGEINLNPLGSQQIYNCLTTNENVPFLVKYDQNGVYIDGFYLEMSSACGASFKDVAVDSSGNVFVSIISGNSQCLDSLDLDPGPGVLYANYPSEFVVIKYSPDLVPIWTKSFSNMNFAYIDIFVDPVGFPYFNVNENSLVKLNPENGNIIWDIPTLGKPIFDGLSKFYVVEEFSYDGYGNSISTSSQAVQQINMMTFDTSGLMLNQNLLGETNGGDFQGYLKYDPTGNIIIKGLYHGNINIYTGTDTLTRSNFDILSDNDPNFPSSWKILRDFYLKIDTSLNFEWFKSLESYAGWTTISPNPYEIAINEEGDIFAFGTGWWPKVYDFNDSTLIVFNNPAEHYIVQYDSLLNFKGVTSFLGDYGPSSYHGVKYSKFIGDSLLLIGQFRESTDIDMTDNTQLLFANTFNSWDVDFFAVQYSGLEILGYPPNKFYSNPGHDNDNIFKLYPNPASDYVIIELEDNSSIGNIEVYNLTGQLVLKREINGEQKIPLNLTGINSGIYLVVVNIQGTVKVQKLIKKQ